MRINWAKLIIAGTLPIFLPEPNHSTLVLWLLSRNFKHFGKIQLSNYFLEKIPFLLLDFGISQIIASLLLSLLSRICNHYLIHVLASQACNTNELTLFGSSSHTTSESLNSLILSKNVYPYPSSPSGSIEEPSYHSLKDVTNIRLGNSF